MVRPIDGMLAHTSGDVVCALKRVVVCLLPTDNVRAY
ncbi:hypothetical protein SAMN06264855_107146 [Halorubrum vacuolatum]|uniref:Uncharacterized protein n=1 Tax=Halorubrum vacuolatum TaxID=63740 RepID=A0A238WHE4_HALVU|nr:hypothetical protein SAMN06264855_107146 [Halorubrum vacuolatum]